MLDDVEAEVRRILASVRYGSVTLIVQDGRVIQIDTTTKMRLPPVSAAEARVGRR